MFTELRIITVLKILSSRIFRRCFYFTNTDRSIRMCALLEYNYRFTVNQKNFSVDIFCVDVGDLPCLLLFISMIANQV